MIKLLAVVRFILPVFFCIGPLNFYMNFHILFQVNRGCWTDKWQPHGTQVRNEWHVRKTNRPRDCQSGPCQHILLSCIPQQGTLPHVVTLPSFFHSSLFFFSAFFAELFKESQICCLFHLRHSNILLIKFSHIFSIIVSSCKWIQLSGKGSWPVLFVGLSCLHPILWTFLWFPRSYLKAWTCQVTLCYASNRAVTLNATAFVLKKIV